MPALRAAGFEVVGLVGTDAERTAFRAKSGGVPQSFTDLDDAISRTDPTIVAISTPPATHCALTLKALARRRHVLCEKPFASDLAEARLMLEAAEAAGVVHMLGNEFRFEPRRALIARAIAEGLIGEPRLLGIVQFSAYAARQDANLPSWWLEPSAGGGWLGAWGSHLIDQIRVEIGDFALVSAALPKVSLSADGVEDSFIIRFQLTNGTEGVLLQSAGALGPLAGLFRVAGTKGTIWTEGNAVRFADGEGARELPIPADLALPPPPDPGPDPRHKTAEWQRLTSLELAPYTKLCSILKRAILGDRPFKRPLPATFADGVAAMKVIDAIRASAAKGGAAIQI